MTKLKIARTDPEMQTFEVWEKADEVYENICVHLPCFDRKPVDPRGCIYSGRGFGNASADPRVETDGLCGMSDGNSMKEMVQRNGRARQCSRQRQDGLLQIRRRDVGDDGRVELSR